MIKDLKELDKFLRICRKQGVTEITVDGISVKIGDLRNDAPADNHTHDDIQTDDLTPEQLVFFAAGGVQ
jgi:hypothetical protein